MRPDAMVSIDEVASHAEWLEKTRHIARATHVAFFLAVRVERAPRRSFELRELLLEAGNVA